MMKLSPYFAVAAICLFTAPTFSQEDDSNSSPIVIVHGAWGGAHHWKAVADSLTRDHGKTVRRASLTGLGERSHLATKQVNLSTHIRDVVNLIEFDDLKSVVLIAHSYGGVVATGVVDAIPDRIAHVIYIDSHLINDGECYLTHHDKLRARVTERAKEAGEGWLIPVDWENSVRDTPHPLATLTEPLKLSRTAVPQIKSTYWLLADGRPAEQDQRHMYLERAKQRGWPTRTFAWNHNPQRERPSDVVRELLKEID